jgi:methionyl-tRNA formyltransferase
VKKAALRIVSLNAFLPGYRIVADWAERHGHEIVLVATVPRTGGRRYGGTNPLVVDLPDETNVLVTGKLREVAAPMIEALRPDLLICATFPRIIPPEILRIPKYGALNCHPSPLPAGRGQNPARLIYEGDERVTASVHRMEATIDAGPIMAQRSRPLPTDLNGAALMAAWDAMLGECLDEAVPKAIAGEAGLPQDASLASDAPVFTPAEQRLDLTEPADVIRRKAAALNVTSLQARIHFDGVDHIIARAGEVGCAGTPSSRAEAGALLETTAEGWIFQTGDRPLRFFSS